MTDSVSMNLGNPANVSQTTTHEIFKIEAITHTGFAFEQFNSRIRRGLPPRILQRVRDYVEAHLGNDINLQVLASTAGLSISNFSREFKKAEGVNPHHYLVQCRVRRALELLAGTDLPLAEIAHACGFSDQSHLTCRFRQHVGTTPGDYRCLMRRRFQ